jgi:signal peptidase I
MDDVVRQVALELSGAFLAGQGQLRLKVTSHSMSPLIKPGDHVLVKHVTREGLHRGDILVTQRSDSYLTHRLVGVDERGWHTKGDRNRLADSPVSVESIVGMVVALERNGHSRSVCTRYQIFWARISGWLGWKEANFTSLPAILVTRFFSRIIMVFQLL